jgi:hypothetical protein
MYSLQDANYIASMMLTATPILALMIVTGSFYAMTSLASRMSGGDHFNEKGLAADASTSTPLVTHTSGLTHSPYEGTENKSLSQVSFSGASMLGAQKSIGTSHVDQSGRDIANTISSSDTWQQMSGADRIASTENNSNYGLGQATKDGYATGMKSVIGDSVDSDHKKQYSHDKSETETVSTQIQAQFGGSLGGAPPPQPTSRPGSPRRAPRGRSSANRYPTPRRRRYQSPSMIREESAGFERIRASRRERLPLRPLC